MQKSEKYFFLNMLTKMNANIFDIFFRERRFSIFVEITNSYCRKFQVTLVTNVNFGNMMRFKVKNK